jgi:hypothetical protein
MKAIQPTKTRRLRSTANRCGDAADPRAGPGVAAVDIRAAIHRSRQPPPVAAHKEPVTMPAQLKKVLYTAEAVVEGGREGHGRTRDGRLEVDLSVPGSMSGDDGPGTNPEQLFAVGYAVCFQSALLGVARGRTGVCVAVVEPKAGRPLLRLLGLASITVSFLAASSAPSAVCHLSSGVGFLGADHDRGLRRVRRRLSRSVAHGGTALRPRRKTTSAACGHPRARRTRNHRRHLRRRRWPHRRLTSPLLTSLQTGKRS